MTNFEKHQYDILRIVETNNSVAMQNNKIRSCFGLACKNCEFFTDDANCISTLIKWLYEDDGEPTHLELQNAKLAKKLENQRNEITRLLKVINEMEVIKVGDVVQRINCNLNGVVISIDDSWVFGIASDGANFEWHKDGVVKTGRTLPVEDWLKQI